jgi:hypothetical protein
LRIGNQKQHFISLLLNNIAGYMTDLNREFARAYKASKQRQDEFAEISRRVKFITRIANKYVARRVSLLDVCCGNGMLVKSLERDMPALA